MRIITGFHAIEELIKSGSYTNEGGRPRLMHSKPGPRVKKILELAKKAGVPASLVTDRELDRIVLPLDKSIREHRGLVLTVEGLENEAPQNTVIFEDFIARTQNTESSTEADNSLVVILDSITDPHNIGAILRSCDQFGSDLVILPERNSPKDSVIIERSSAGASSWVAQSRVTNLTRAVEKLKEAGYWIYGADAGGESITDIKMSGKVVLILGSEGTGMSRLLKESCDKIVSIPTCGKLDSLNVSVAAGVLLYEIRQRKLL